MTTKEMNDLLRRLNAANERGDYAEARRINAELERKLNLA